MLLYDLYTTLRITAAQFLFEYLVHTKVTVLKIKKLKVNDIQGIKG